MVAAHRQCCAVTRVVYTGLPGDNPFTVFRDMSLHLSVFITAREPSAPAGPARTLRGTVRDKTLRGSRRRAADRCQTDPQVRSHTSGRPPAFVRCDLLDSRCGAFNCCRKPSLRSILKIARKVNATKISPLYVSGFPYVTAMRREEKKNCDQSEVE